MKMSGIKFLVFASLFCYQSNLVLSQDIFYDYDFDNFNNNQQQPPAPAPSLPPQPNIPSLQPIPVQPLPGIPAPTRPGSTTTTTTTASPIFTNCLNNCPITPQYNPVCGTNMVSYNNLQRLRCAQQCGLSVEVNHIGTCGASAGGK